MPSRLSRGAGKLSGLAGGDGRESGVFSCPFRSQCLFMILNRTKGYVDLHIHGFGRYGTRDAAPEEILKLAELQGRAGTAAILPTIYSGPLREMRADMEAVKKAMETQQSVTSVQKGRSPAVILGVHLEGPFLSPARSGALDRDSFIKPSVASLKKLTDGYEEIIRIVTVAPELPGSLKVIEKCVETGIRVNMGHSDATYEEAEEGKMAGATGITHIFNAMRPFHHREPGIAGFGLLDNDIYVEVIADGIHLRRETLRLIFLAKRRDKIILVSDSVRGARRRGKPVFRGAGMLAGSGMPLADSAGFLGKIGISGSGVAAAVTSNPVRYLRDP